MDDPLSAAWRTPLPGGSRQDHGRRPPAGLLYVCLLGLMTGCRVLATQGPDPESLTTCRQLSQQAYAAMQRNAWQQAEELLGQAIQACPASGEARRYYAETLWHRRAFDRAVIQIEIAVRLDQDDAEAAVRAGEMRLALGHLARAQTHADHAIDRDPQLAAAWRLHGQVMQAAGQADLALADFHHALDLTPNDRNTLLQVAELYRHRNQPRRALATLQYLADLYPPGEEPGRVFYLQGLACSALHRYPDAVDCFQTATTHGESTAEAFFRLATAQLAAGRPEAADRAVRHALALDRHHQPSLKLRERMATARQPTGRSYLR